MYLPPLNDYNTTHIVSGNGLTRNWVCPEGVHNISIYVVGGGGGGASTVSSAGGGGGAGGTIQAIQRVIPGETYTLYAGLKGVGGLFVGPYDGTTGGSSYFKYGATNLLTATGGVGAIHGAGTGGAGGSGLLSAEILSNVVYSLTSGGAGQSSASGGDGGDNLWAVGGQGKVGGGFPGGGGAGYTNGINSNNGANGGDGGNGGLVIRYNLDPMVTDNIPA